MCEFPVLQCMLKEFCDHLWTDQDFTFHIVPRFTCDFFLPLLSPHFDQKHLFLHFRHCFSNHTKQSELPDIFQQLLCAVEFCWQCYRSGSKYFDAVVIALLCLFFFHTLSELRVAWQLLVVITLTCLFFLSYIRWTESCLIVVVFLIRLWR